MFVVAFASLLILSCGYACIFGGTPERIGASAMASAAVLSLLLAPSQGSFRDIEWGIFGVDCALLIGLAWLALRANRYWPLWVSSLQLVTVWSHLGFVTAAIGIPAAYAFASIMWSFPMLIILALGTLRHRQRVRRYTVDPPWNGF